MLKTSPPYAIPDYVDDGMDVIAPYVHEGRPVGLRCVVVVAAGYHAQVRNETYDFQRWFHIDQLRIERT